MIIIQTASKDTFVTDMSAQNNKGVDANFGQASTLDLFKIVGENKNVKSRAMLTIDIARLIDGDTFTITDYSGVSNTFEFDNENNVINGNISFFDPGGNQTVIDNLVTRISVDADVKITAYKLDSDKILLQQNASGAAGDTIPVVSQVDAGNTRITITPFRRFEHSAALLTFDLKSIVDEHIHTLNDSIFSTTPPAADFKAFLKLKDVGVASTSPKDFKLRLRVLSNDFNEGIGRDVLHFSDLGDANFKTINSLATPIVTWTNEGIVSVDDVYTTSSLDTEVEVKTGEDIVFDITNHVYAFMIDNSLSQTFVIDIAHENLFDEFTYFVKRLGSRNLSNKFNRPKIEIKVKDEKFENISYSTKKRFLNNDETFYLTNLVNKKLVGFPSTSQKLNLEFLGNVRETESINFLRNPIADTSFSITDSANNTINIRLTYANDAGITSEGAAGNFYIGIFSLGQNPGINLSTAVRKIATELQTRVGPGFELTNLTFTASGTTLNITNVGLSENNIFNTIVDTQTTMIVKRNSVNKNIFVDDISSTAVRSYKGEVIDGIKKFTIADTVLSKFETNSTFKTALEKDGFAKIKLKYTATKGAVDLLVKTEDVNFYLPEASEVDLYKKLRVVLNTQQKQIIADDGVKTLQFSFIDLAKQYDSVKTPIELTSEDLGEVTYSLYDVDTGVYLLKNDSDFGDTSMFYNGKHYIANFYASEVFKNTRVSFDFEYTDPLSGLKKKISDKKLIVRFE